MPPPAASSSVDPAQIFGRMNPPQLVIGRLAHLAAGTSSPDSRSARDAEGSPATARAARDGGRNPMVDHAPVREQRDGHRSLSAVQMPIMTRSFVFAVHSNHSKIDASKDIVPLACDRTILFHVKPAAHRGRSTCATPRDRSSASPASGTLWHDLKTAAS